MDFLNAERFAAAAGLICVRIDKFKAAVLKGIRIIECGAVQVEEAFGVDVEFDAVIAELMVFVFLEVEVDGVGKAGAASAFDHHAQAHSCFVVTLFDQPPDFFSGIGSQINHELSVPCKGSSVKWKNRTVGRRP